MKLNFKFSLNIILLLISFVIISMYLYNLAQEKYEESVGPGEFIEEAAKEKNLTQAELDAVLKFIR